MSPNEPNGHARFGDDVAPWLLGALADEERQEFERHLAACGRCREEVAALRPAVEALPLAAPPVVPSPELRDRIMSVVESEAQLLEAAGEHADRPPKAARKRRRRPAFGGLRPALVGGLAAACALEGARELFALYVTRVPTYQLIYGALSALPVFLLWIYFGWIIVLAGAAVTATLAEGARRSRG